jgi:hypothetical protein
MDKMKNFSSYLTEARWATEDKLTHLEHPEDHIVKSGEPGFHHAFNTLKSTAEHLQGHDTGVKIMTKYDGAPSIVFGHNPENGRFFVASKSAWNKNPKVNYTEADIEANHGHAPGLVAKLKAGLKHLPKIAPKRGVYQGDFLYNKAENDVKETDGNYHFRPQLIGYTAKKDSEQGRKIAAADIGLAVHTGYKGTSLSNMKADYTPDLKGFKTHKSVHLHAWDKSFNPARAKYSAAHHADFKDNMNAAGEHFKSADRSKLFSLAHHPELQTHLSTYINKAVRTGESHSVEGLKGHVAERHGKALAGLKTDKARQQRQAQLQSHLDYIHSNRAHVNNLLKVHGHLSRAKNAMMDALDRADTSGYSYDVGGKKTRPEGYVAVINNRPTKLIDRGEFSRLNLTQGKFQKK